MNMIFKKCVQKYDSNLVSQGETFKKSYVGTVWGGTPQNNLYDPKWCNLLPHGKKKC